MYPTKSDLGSARVPLSRYSGKLRLLLASGRYASRHFRRCRLNFQGKVTLTRSSYLNAVGQIVDDALFRVMDDVLALEDIPEADSERLSELCDMLAPLEELFMDVSGGVSKRLRVHVIHIDWLFP